MNTNYHYVCTTFTSHENMSDTDSNAPSNNLVKLYHLEKCVFKRHRQKKMWTMQKETNLFFCARKQNSSLEQLHNTADCVFPLFLHNALSITVLNTVYMYYNISTYLRVLTTKSLMRLTGSEIPSDTFMIFTVLREPSGHKLQSATYRLQWDC